MGVWGYNVFENDDSLDYVADLTYENAWIAVNEALQAVTAADGYIEANECSVALAGAELIASACGQPAASLPPEVSSLASSLPSPGAPLIGEAMRAVETLQSESELRDVWEETDEYASWNAQVDDLRSRLAMCGPR